MVKFAKDAKIFLTGEQDNNYIQVDSKGVPVAFVGHKATAFFRLRMIYRGLEFEVENPNMRLTAKAPKCSTLVKREFGLKGTPAKLLEQMHEIMKWVTPESEGIAVVTRDASGELVPA